MDIKKNVFEIKQRAKGIELAVNSFRKKIEKNKQSKFNSQDKVMGEKEMKYIKEAATDIEKKCLEIRELVMRGLLGESWLKPLNEIIMVCDNLRKDLPDYLSWMQIYHDRAFIPVERNFLALKKMADQLKA